MTQIRALQMLSEKDLALRQIDPPPPPGPGEVRLRVRFVGINHIDVFGLRGMAPRRRAR
jgi:NADPH:quinone reductase-like Zn-dependent oxidoreductase